MVVLDSVTKFQLEKRANQILSEFGYDFQNNTLVNITALAVSLGFSVKETNTIFSCADAILRVDKKHKSIHLNRIQPFEQKRLAIAFLIAHNIVCDSTKVFLALKNEYHWNTKPKQHWFDEPEMSRQAYLAMCLLMPKESFANQYNTLKRHGLDSASSITMLQDIYKVPREVVSYWLPATEFQSSLT